MSGKKRKTQVSQEEKLMRRTGVLTGLFSVILIIVSIIFWAKLEPIATTMDLVVGIQTAPAGQWLFTPLGGVLGGVIIGFFYITILILVATIRETMGTISGWSDVIILLIVSGFLGFLFFNGWAGLIAVVIGCLFTYYLHITPTEDT
ncbi:MAG: hypothetical protein ACXACA_02070 [Candidatus Ranarchaeia archaeon]|jgi:hypothetical protein